MAEISFRGAIRIPAERPRRGMRGPATTLEGRARASPGESPNIAAKPGSPDRIYGRTGVPSTRVRAARAQVVLALTVRSRYGEDVSLRRLRYQLECRRSGHDVRPYMVDGSRVVQRCLRCGAIVDESEQDAVETVPDVVPPRRPEPQPSNLPPARVDERPETDDPRVPESGRTDAGADDAETDEDSAHAALAALRELGELHAAGVITDREFALKKAELLRRV